MEKDDELKGNGNSYDFGARIYDSRLGRFLSIDPLCSIYPEIGPYVYCNDNPIMYQEVDGNGFNGGFSIENQSTQPIVIVGTAATVEKVIVTNTPGYMSYSKPPVEGTAKEVTLQPGDRYEARVKLIQSTTTYGSIINEYRLCGVIIDKAGKETEVNVFDVDYIALQEGQTFVNGNNRFNTDPNDKNARTPNPLTGEATIKLQPGKISAGISDILIKPSLMENIGEVIITGNEEALEIETKGFPGLTPKVIYGEGISHEE